MKPLYYHRSDLKKTSPVFPSAPHAEAVAHFLRAVEKVAAEVTDVLYSIAPLYTAFVVHEIIEHQSEIDGEWQIIPNQMSPTA